jgi:hypothetical protein
MGDVEKRQDDLKKKKKLIINQLGYESFPS